MAEEQNYEHDLQFVRDVVAKSEDSRGPVSIYYLWAVLCLIGFSLVDIAPELVGLFWIIAGPTGGIISGFLGWRYSKNLGQVSQKEGSSQVLHWLGTVVAICLVFLMVINNFMDAANTGHVILLILALSYFLSGVHQNRPLLWVGVMLGISYIVVTFVRGPVWTIAGIAVSASLVVAALTGGPREQN